jgi:hypothetical protein
MPKLTLVAVLFLASSVKADAGLVEVAAPTT